MIGAYRYIPVGNGLYPSTLCILYKYKYGIHTTKHVVMKMTVIATRQLAVLRCSKCRSNPCIHSFTSPLASAMQVP